MTETPEPSIDQLRFDMERQRLELEQQKFKADNRFFNKNFGVIITGIISCATVLVSLIQLEISGNNASNQQQLERDKNDNMFSFEVAKFLLEQREEITTTDVTRAKYIRNVVIAAFPTKVAGQISSTMRDSWPTGDIKQVWADTVVYTESKTIQILPAASGTSGLTSEKLANEFKELNTGGSKAELDAILARAREFGITEKNETSIYLAMVFYNSSFLRQKVENLTYPSAQRIMAVWPTRVKSVEEAERYVKEPEKLGNLVYGGRMGNHDEGDGYKYRGRGYLLTTGRNTYKEIGAAINVPLEEQPDKLLEPDTMARAAAYEFSTRTAAARKAGNFDLVRASFLLNGGYFGVAEQKSIYDRISKID